MDALKFRTILKNLKEGDFVTFVFKGRVRWATNFLALFNVKPLAFEMSQLSEVDLKFINYLMGANVVCRPRIQVVCKVLNALDKTQLNIDWMVEHIFPSLDDFIVRKVRKPE